MSLYEHQMQGVNFLMFRKSAMLADDMGLGKSRQALTAAQRLYAEKKIDRILILAPAAVRYSWRTEIEKLESEGLSFLPCIYDAKKQLVYGESRPGAPLPVLIISYALLPNHKHAYALQHWCSGGKTLLICDESSFLKNRTAKQTKGAKYLSEASRYCWLLTGTPIANSPLDLYGQALVMSNGNGPLHSFRSFYHFRARYAVLKMMNMGQIRFQQVVSYQNLDELSKRFAPYVLRRTKQECLDLPEKTYTVREIPLSAETWRVYQELKREAMLALPDSEERPEPNAAVRILRLCQLTSGHVGIPQDGMRDESEAEFNFSRDVSDEKLSWLVEQILDGELSTQQALIVWCRWRRERERLKQLLATKIDIYSVFGGQQEHNRSAELGLFTSSDKRRVLIAQQHAGGFGLNLTAANTAVYLSNSFSFTDRIQSEDRCHRIGQTNPVLYIDVVAVGPNGQRTVDAHVLECLRAKKSVADETCAGWRKVLNG